MSAWRSLLRIFWTLKWPMLTALVAVVFWLVVLENVNLADLDASDFLF